MDNETQGQSTPPAVETPQKKSGIFGKLAALWKSGIKGKAICIVGVLVILGIIGSCGDDEEGGGDWKLSKESFNSVFSGVSKDEGVVYNHQGYGLVVLQALKNGNLVERDYSDRVIWVETKRRYEDGEPLDKGYYIRRGSYEYKNALGAESTVGRYIEVTDKGFLEKIQKQVEEEKAAAEKAAIEAEGTPFEIDAPIKSLCGFAIGATPHSVKPLFKEDPTHSFKGELATPFRHFDIAFMEFRPDPRFGGKHLCRVELGLKDPKILEDSKDAAQEIETVVTMLEEKFGIKFKRYCCRDGENEISIVGKVCHSHSTSGLHFFCKWESDGGADSISQYIWIEDVVFDGVRLVFKSDFISKEEEAALNEKAKPDKLSANAGADQL